MTPSRFTPTLSARLVGLGLLFIVEKAVLSFFVDFDRAQAAEGFGATVRVAQHWGLRFLVTFALALALFAYVRNGERLKLAAEALRSSKVHGGWLLLHFLLIACLIPNSYFLYRNETVFLPFSAVAISWMAVGLMSAGSALLAVAPWSLWCATTRALGILWSYAALAAGLGTLAMHFGQRLWVVTASLTFYLVRLVLTPFVSTLSADSASHVIRTQQFAVEISETCSGLEGMCLILAFTAAWLTYFRREYIFPRALLLIPTGLLSIFALNVLRIAVLVGVGDAGFSEVAEYGFHSQAGWIAFNLVACTLVFFSRRSAWLNRTAPNSISSSDVHNPTAAYLSPLLALLAAGSLSHALSGRFELFYPLRLIAVSATLLAFRKTLYGIGWQVTWRGPVAGAGVFLLWAAAARWLMPAMPEPQQLASMLTLPRVLWIASHCLASVVLVPLAEELAYRGYLMRRLVTADFELVPYCTMRWPALIISAVVFGAAHGVLWIPGTVAGVIYGLLTIRQGSLGDSVAAHATTNGLLAMAVVVDDQWQLWQ